MARNDKLDRYVAALRASVSKALETGASQTVRHDMGHGKIFSRAEEVAMRHLDTSRWLERWETQGDGVCIRVRAEYRDDLAAERSDDPTVPRRSSAVLIERDGEFCVVFERKHGGEPCMPGGKAEPGESAVATARREVREELGVKVTVYDQPLGVVEHDHGGRRWRCTFFVGHLFDGEPKGGDAGDCGWATRDRILSNPYGEVMRRAFDLYDAAVERASRGGPSPV